MGVVSVQRFALVKWKSNFVGRHFLQATHTGVWILRDSTISRLYYYFVPIGHFETIYFGYFETMPWTSRDNWSLRDFLNFANFETLHEPCFRTKRWWMKSSIFNFAAFTCSSEPSNFTSALPLMTCRQKEDAWLIYKNNIGSVSSHGTYPKATQVVFTFSIFIRFTRDEGANCCTKIIDAYIRQEKIP